MSLGGGHETTPCDGRQGGRESAPQGRGREAFIKARPPPRAARTAELQRQLIEAHAQQAATSEVLKAISRSRGEPEPVFQAILERAVRLCEAKFGTLFRYDGENFHRLASVGTPPALVEYQKQRGAFRPPRGSGTLARLLRTGKVVHSDDSATDPNPGVATTVGGARSIVGVPMLENNKLAGAIVIYRQEVRPFTNRQIELLEHFAAQAVIAIENARLLNELRQRTDDLSESLEQQTATSEVLKIISSSPGELTAVFQAMLANATRICDAKFGIMYEFAGGKFRARSCMQVPPAYADYVTHWRDWGPGTGLGQVARTRQIVHTHDVVEGRAYAEGDPGRVATVDLGGVRTSLVVPMLKDGELGGAFVIYRQEVRPFTDKQIELMSNFAAQAVIAIENARLLNELRESLQQQTATSEVLSIISSSPGDLEPVFQAMLANATHICEAHFGCMFRYDNGAFRPAALLNVPERLADHIRQRGPFQALPGSVLDQVLSTGDVAHVEDDAAGPSPASPARLAGARSTIAVPMLKNDILVGAIVIYRQEIRPFTGKQIELVKNFAAQAVIAIENTRLLNDLRQRTDDLTESLEQQTATSEILSVISRSPATCSRSLKPCWRKPCKSPGPDPVGSLCVKATASAPSARMAYRPYFPRSAGEIR